jgi:hypothetical protein
MFGGAVNRRADLGEQSGGGNRVEKPAAPPLDHARQHRPRGIHMRHHMNAPAQRPNLIRRRGGIIEIRIGGNDAGIRTEQVDRSGVRLRLPHQPLNVALHGNIATERHAVDGGRGLLRATLVQIGDRYVLRTLRMKPLGQGTAYAAAAAGDDNHLARDVH